MAPPIPPFHLAIPVDDLAAAERFYAGVLGCRPARRDRRWVDFDFFGHQLTAHLAGQEDDTGAHRTAAAPTNAVDGDDVPVRHFGVVLAPDDWERLHVRIADAALPFLVAPRVRFRGEVGEQMTFFVRDPSGNALEFKSFRDPSRMFAADDDEESA